MKLPFLFLDVDGAACPLDQQQDLDSLPAGFERALIGHYNGFVASFMKEAMPRLAARTELIWVTSWEESAPELIAPLFGVPLGGRYLPVRPDGKLAAIQSAVDGRPFVWVDDQLGRKERAWAAERSEANLLVKPQIERGLTERQVAKIEAFLDSLL